MTPPSYGSHLQLLNGVSRHKANIAEAFLNALMNIILAPALARYLG